MKWEEYFKMENVRNFFEGTFNKFRDNFEFMSLAPHIKEQTVYRAMLCKDCYSNGSCKDCGCNTPDMFYAPNKVDALNKWGAMITDARMWEIYKKENNIYIDPKLAKDIEKVLIEEDTDTSYKDKYINETER